MAVGIAESNSVNIAAPSRKSIASSDGRFKKEYDEPRDKARCYGKDEIWRPYGAPYQSQIFFSGSRGIEITRFIVR